MRDEARSEWENLFDPEVVRPLLISVSLYLAAYEILKATVVDRVQAFFSDGFEQHGGRILDASYGVEVLKLGKSEVSACILWHQNQGAIDDNDVASMAQLKALRDDLAHGLHKYVLSPMELPQHFEESFAECLRILDKIERWWIVEFEIPINSDFDDVEFDPAGITPGTTLLLQLLTQTALGDLEAARKALQDLRDAMASERAMPRQPKSAP